MRRRHLAIPVALAALSISSVLAAAEGSRSASPIAMVIHGGAGTIEREDLSTELEASYRDKLKEALLVGHGILKQGGTSLDAVEATIRLLENSPLFNAGKGAVFTAAGKNELDASIMEGHTLRAGAVAGVTTLKNPISAARAVMEKTRHVLLAGEGADRFAAQIGLEQVPSDYFFTERRWQALEKRRAEERHKESEADKTMGTVGAVALDRKGNLAAGTSTGGMTFKKHGRVGDSPVVGAGTYANAKCGVSGTGHGEFFIRYAVAHDICARVEYLGLSIQEAARQIVLEDLVEAGGSGGVIALGADGTPALVFNTSGMYRGFVDDSGKTHVGIYQEPIYKQ
ncbi:MAG: isoaspartyl peptidase/L-asparaginase [Acidobacteriota bacterium]|nr:isoaspartyl peptidase/L-asparaginase [Acidobacteriota bacterium]